MQQGIANSTDAELILKLYELRTESVMREARAWVNGQFWPMRADEFFAVADDVSSQKSAWLRQVVSYWEMAVSLVLHGALSADLFIDCNAEPFFLLAKLEPILPDIHAKSPTYFHKTLQLIENSPAAAARYEAVKKHVESVRQARNAEWLRQPASAH
jgi:hypothetical protein